MSTKNTDHAQDPNPLPSTAAGAPETAAPAAELAAELAGNAAAPADAPAANAAPADSAPAADAVEAAVSASDADPDADPDAEPAPELPGQLPGELLAARRIEMRLSIEELSTRVKLAPRQLVALEANDFGALPGMATTRGFIRSCAKALGMDPEPLLAMVAHEPNPALGPMIMRRPLPQPGFNGRRYAPSTSHRRGSKRLSGLAAVLVIFVGLLSYLAWRNDMLHLPDLDFAAARDAMMPSSGSAASDASDAPGTPGAQAGQGGTPVSDAGVYAPATTAPAAPSARTDGTKADGAKADNAKADNAKADNAKADSTKASPAGNAAASIDPARALELKLREDAWVEVLTQNGERKLVSRLMKAGSTERVDVSEPVILVIGNAAGVDVTLRGQPVNLKPGTRDNVAKINLK